jgi:hypothetical protein
MRSTRRGTKEENNINNMQRQQHTKRNTIIAQKAKRAQGGDPAREDASAERDTDTGKSSHTPRPAYLVRSVGMSMKASESLEIGSELLSIDTVHACMN